ncbi:unnamed protein product [Paramecium sonneborni]|uniref:Uncharacterized protein n=1 Tax=Paramecium sonneborni TaxID=65129 RepID=A0A8S1QY61_9CILI|nr:unnamed protein product [Paramecium sonneborni]
MFVNQEMILKEMIEQYNYKDVQNLECLYQHLILQNQNKLNQLKIVYLKQLTKNKFLIQLIFVNKLCKKCQIMLLIVVIKNQFQHKL